MGYSPWGRKKLDTTEGLTLWDLMDHTLPGSSVHGILQARILEWAAIPFSRVIFSTQGLKIHLLYLLHCQVGSLPLPHLGSPYIFLQIHGGNVHSIKR